MIERSIQRSNEVLQAEKNLPRPPGKEIFIFDDNTIIAPCQQFYSCGGYDENNHHLAQTGEATVVLSPAIERKDLTDNDAYQALFKKNLLKELLTLVESHKKAGISGPIQANISFPQLEVDIHSNLYPHIIKAYQEALAELNNIQNNYKDGTCYLAAVRVSFPKKEQTKKFDKAFENCNKTPGIKIKSSTKSVDNLSEKIVDLPLLRQAVVVPAPNNNEKEPSIFRNFVFSAEIFNTEDNAVNARYFKFELETKENIATALENFNNALDDPELDYFKILSILHKSPTVFQKFEEEANESSISAVLHFFQDYQEFMALPPEAEEKWRKYEEIYKKYCVSPLPENDLNNATAKQNLSDLYDDFNVATANETLTTISKSICNYRRSSNILKDFILAKKHTGNNIFNNFRKQINNTFPAHEISESINNADFFKVIDDTTPSTYKNKWESTCQEATNEFVNYISQFYTKDTDGYYIHNLEQDIPNFEKLDQLAKQAVKALNKLNPFYNTYPSYANWEHFDNNAQAIYDWIHLSEISYNRKISHLQEKYNTEYEQDFHSNGSSGATQERIRREVNENDMKEIAEQYPLLNWERGFCSKKEVREYFTNAYSASYTKKIHQENDYAIIDLHRTACKQQSLAAENMVGACMHVRNKGLTLEENAKLTKYVKGTSQLINTDPHNSEYTNLYDKHHENTEEAFGLRNEKWNVVKGAMLAVAAVGILAAAVTTAVLLWPVSLTAGAALLGISIAAYAGISGAALALTAVASTSAAIGASLFAHKDRKGPVANEMENVTKAEKKRWGIK